MISGIIAIVLASFILIGAGLGMIRGAAKSGVRFLLVILSAVLAFVVAKILSTALIEMDISSLELNVKGSSATSVKGLVLDLLKNITIVTELLEASPTLNDVIVNVPSIIICMVMYVVLFFVIKAVLWLVYVIIFAIANKKKDKSETKNKHKFLGAFIGAVQGVFVFLATILPLAGSVYFIKGEVDYIDGASKSSQAVTQTAYISVYASETTGNQPQTNDSTIDTLKSSLNEATSSGAMKVFDKIGYGKLSKLLTKSMTEIKVGDEKTTLFDEAHNIVELYVDYDKLLGDGREFSTWTKEDIQTINHMIDNFFDSKITGNIATELITSAAKEWTDPNSDNTFCSIKKPALSGASSDLFDTFLKEIKNENNDELKSELKVVVRVVDVAVDEEVISKVGKGSSIENVIEPIAEGNVIEKLVNALTTGQATKRIIPKAMQLGLDKMYPILGLSEEETKDLKITKTSSEVNWNKEAKCMNDIFAGLAKTYQSLQKEGKLVDKLDYNGVAQALTAMRDSQLLSSPVGSSTLSKEITIKLLSSGKLDMEGMDGVINQVRTSYDNVNFYTLLNSLRASVNIAKSVQDMLENPASAQIPAEDVAVLLQGLNDETVGGLVDGLTENLSDIMGGKENSTFQAVSGVVDAVTGYEGEETLPTDDAGLDNAASAATNLFEVVTGTKGTTDNKFFAEMNDLVDFVIGIKKSNYVYSITLSGSEALGFVDSSKNSLLSNSEKEFVISLCSSMYEGNEFTSSDGTRMVLFTSETAEVFKTDMNTLFGQDIALA